MGKASELRQLLKSGGALVMPDADAPSFRSNPRAARRRDR